MTDAYKRECRFCGEDIIMSVAPGGHWVPLDLYGGYHYCGSGNKGKQKAGLGKEWDSPNWGEWPPEHAVTFCVECWFCGEEVYVHSNGNGDSVLLEPPLGVPWTRHDCLGMTVVTPRQLSNKVSWTAAVQYKDYVQSLKARKQILPRELPASGKVTGILKQVEERIAEIVTEAGEVYSMKLVHNLGLEVGTVGEFEYANTKRTLYLHTAYVPSPAQDTPNVTETRSFFPIQPARPLSRREAVVVRAMHRKQKSHTALCMIVYDSRSPRCRALLKQILKAPGGRPGPITALPPKTVDS